MENKIDISQLLKDCPKGMELDCTLYDNIVLDSSSNWIYPIKVTTKDGGTSLNLTKYGCLSENKNAKCVIFPKGKTTWEGFQRPFKDGDILISGLANCGYNPFIFKQTNGLGNAQCYCAINVFEELVLNNDNWTPIKGCRLATEEEKEKLFQAIKDNGYEWNSETKTLEKVVESRFHAGDWITDGVRKCQILFIDDIQYWYSENGILGSIESIDKRYHLWTINDAKDGDVLAINWHEGDDSWEKIVIFKKYHNNDDVVGTCVEGYGNTFKNGKLVWDAEVPFFSKTWTGTLQPATKEQRDFLFQKIKEAGYEWNPRTKTLEKLVEPKFKIGDRIKRKGIDDVYALAIADILQTIYIFKDKNWYSIEYVDKDYELIGDVDKDYELVPLKFDITTLKPFESKVLVRDNDSNSWCPAIFGSKISTNTIYKYVTMTEKYYAQCIPYEGNEHLSGTTNDCDNYYKNW